MKTAVKTPVMKIRCNKREGDRLSGKYRSWYVDEHDKHCSEDEVLLSLGINPN